VPSTTAPSPCCAHCRDHWSPHAKTRVRRWGGRKAEAGRSFGSRQVRDAGTPTDRAAQSRIRENSARTERRPTPMAVEAKPSPLRRTLPFLLTPPHWSRLQAAAGRRANATLLAAGGRARSQRAVPRATHGRRLPVRGARQRKKCARPPIPPLPPLCCSPCCCILPCLTRNYWRVKVGTAFFLGKRLLWHRGFVIAPLRLLPLWFTKRALGRG